MRNVRRSSIVSLAAVAAMVSVSLAAEEDKPIEVSTRVYDLSDLVRRTPNYPLAPTNGTAVKPKPGGGGGAGTGDPENGGAVASVDELMLVFHTSLIRETIAVGSWKEDGGLYGMLRCIQTNAGTVMVVTQTPDAHKQIEGLLAELRDSSGPRAMVRVRATWVMLDPKIVDTLLDAPPVHTTATTRAAAWEGSMAVDEAALDTILNSADALTVSQAQATCFNGQTVGVQSGQETAIVSDITPVVGTGAVGYDTTIEKIFSGVKLQLTPQLVPNRPNVVLDLHSTVANTRVETAAAPPATTQPNGVADALAYVQRPRSELQSFETTVRVPLGRRVIVGGVKPTMGTSGNDRRTLYLIVRVDAVQ